MENEWITKILFEPVFRCYIDAWCRLELLAYKPVNLYNDTGLYVANNYVTAIIENTFNAWFICIP